MAVGWSGADPQEAADPADYELGSRQQASEPITLTHVRVWAGANEIDFPGRVGKIWTTSGVLLASAVMPTSLPVGWSTHELSSPVERLAGEQYVVSYSTGGNYGVLVDALDDAVVSADGAVTTLSSAAVPNGVYNENPGSFPSLSVGNWYGVDVAYDLGVASGTAPTITAVDVAADGLQVEVTITATDPDGLDDATYRADWGDGETSSGSTPTLNHTYATSGVKAILARVTDAGGLSAYAAAAVDVQAAPGDGSQSPIHPVQAAIHARLTGDNVLMGMVTGVWDQVPEPASKPYVRIGDHLSIPDNDHGGFGRNITVTVHVWTEARGNADGQAIARRIGVLLDHRPRELHPAGHRVVSIRNEFDQAVPTTDPQVRHHVIRFRIITSQEES
ncbi:uncharacterized protein DUF3168 [Micromonospora sp. Llam0]|uniref:tail completion protein gp17 n=1 Tax=Micromonospora sp. Llam0 TaxID=2485143 RepID=UPI000F4615D4|nr:DUF4082 domain-containing protein [Micromonospora sp. Llam0]ROO51464.1 uncharacterized protein DUF3168 [Micromonospora sp. Llam0]